MPAVYLFWIGWLYTSQRRKGIAVSLSLFLLSAAAGLWTMTRPGASTASVAFLLLPYEATLAGALGLAFAYGWSAKNIAARIGGRLCLTAAVLIIVAQMLTRSH